MKLIILTCCLLALVSAQELIGKPTSLHTTRYTQNITRYNLINVVLTILSRHRRRELQLRREALH